MKRKLALFMVLAMLFSLVPMNVFAASTLSVSKTVNIADDKAYAVGDIAAGNVPVLKIEENSAGEFNATTQVFRIMLTSNAEWTVSDADMVGKITQAGNAGGAATNDLDTALFKKLSDYEAEITIKQDDVTTTKATIYVPIVFKATGAGEIKATVENRDSAITSGSIVIANAASGGTKTTVASVKDFADKGTLDTIKVDEVQLGSLGFPTDQKVKLSLPSGIQWDSTMYNLATIRGLTSFGGDFNGNVTLSAVAAADTDSKELVLTFSSAAKSASIRGTIVFSGLMVKAGNDAKYGDVTLTVSPQSGADFTNESIVVGKYSEYGVTVESVAKDVPTLYAGGTYYLNGAETLSAIDYTNESNLTTAKLRIKENQSNALIEDRKVHVEFPDGVKLLGWDFTKSDNVATGANDSLTGNAYEVNNRSYVDFFFTQAPGATSKMDMEVKFFVSVRADYVGDIKATVNGAALAGKSTEVVLAKAVAPATFTVAPKDFKLGLQNQPVGDIVVTEPAKGVWDAKSDGTVQLKVKLADGFEWNTDPKVTVTKGDITLRTEGIKTDGPNLYIPIKYGSVTAPAELTLTGGTVDLARTMAEGDYKVGVGGTALIKNNNTNAKVGTFDQSYVPKLVFGRIITPADQNTKTIQKVVFTIDSMEYMVGDTKVTSDVAPYINEQGRTMLPLRAFANALNVSGDNIVWNEAERSVVIFKGDATIKVAIGQASFTKNGVSIPMDTMAIIKDGRTFLPLRAVSQALGAVISWDEATRTVTVQ